MCYQYVNSDQIINVFFFLITISLISSQFHTYDAVSDKKNENMFVTLNNVLQILYQSISCSNTKGLIKFCTSSSMEKMRLILRYNSQFSRESCYSLIKYTLPGTEESMRANQYEKDSAYIVIRHMSLAFRKCLRTRYKRDTSKQFIYIRMFIIYIKYFSTLNISSTINIFTISQRTYYNQFPLGLLHSM